MSVRRLVAKDRYGIGLGALSFAATVLAILGHGAPGAAIF